MSGFTAPVGGDSNRIDYDKIPLIPIGDQVCTLYAIVDLGTQETNFGPKRQVQLTFEFPQEMRVFIEGNDPKPSAIFCTETLSMYKDGNLRKKYIQPMLGKNLTDDEAKVFDLTSLIGKSYVATITHSPDGRWANIASIRPLDEKNMKMFDLTQPRIEQINKTMLFHLSMGFDSENFKNLPNKLREKIIGSEEGKKHAAAGGTFAEPDRSEGGSSNTSAPTGGRKLVMLPEAPNTYEEFMKAGWTDQQLVDNSYAKWEEPKAPSAPSAPSAPPSKPAPAPAPSPSAPAPAPAKPEHPIVMKNQALQANIGQWLSEGWTYEQMVVEGHATWAEGINPDDYSDVPY